MAKEFHKVNFIYGNTGDLFIGNNLIPIDVRMNLYNKLVRDGYELIVYFNQDLKLYFFDAKSKYDCENLDDPSENAAEDFKPRIQNPMLGQGSTLLRVETPEGRPEAAGLNLGMADDIFVLDRLDELMSYEKRRVAVVFDDLLQFARYFGNNYGQMFSSSLFTKMSKWVELQNLNSLFFIIPDGLTKCDIDKELKGRDIWAGFLEKFWKEKSTKLYISKAKHGEIKNYLSYLRLYKSYQIDMRDSKNICAALTVYGMQNNSNLKKIDLNLTANHVSKIDDECCKAMFNYDKENTIEKKLNDYVGMESIKQTVRRIKNSIKADNDRGVGTISYDYKDRLESRDDNVKYTNLNLHYALVGNPGTGKTTAAKLLGQVFREIGALPSGHTVKVVRNDLVGQYVGETEQKTAAKIEEAMGGVLFIDEAYSLFDEEHSSDVGNRALEIILEAMTDKQGEFSVITAGYPKEIKNMIDKGNPGLKRRFNKILEIPDYTSEELLEIFKKTINGQYVATIELLENVKTVLDAKCKIKDRSFGNAGFVADKLIPEIYSSWSEDEGHQSENSLPLLEPKHMPKEYEYILSQKANKTVDDILGEINGMTGLGNVKKQLVRLARSAEFGETTEPGHYVFSGNPGTGKTTVATFMGSLLYKLGLIGSPEIALTSATDFIAGYEGQSGEKATKQLENGRGKVLFIDEAYQFADENDFGKQAFDKIIACIDDKDYRSGTSVIFAGYPDILDRLNEINPGFDRRVKVIKFDDYTLDELWEIFQYMMNEEGFTLFDEEGSHSAFDEYFRKAAQKECFGNAGVVRKYLTEVKQSHWASLSDKYGTKENVPEEEVNRFDVCDFKNASLEMGD